jgi:hypothetical protein
MHDEQESQMQDQSRNANALLTLSLVIQVASLFGFVWLAVTLLGVNSTLRNLQDDLDLVAETTSHPLELEGRMGPFETLRVPGITAPAICNPGDIELADDTQVIGVEINGETRAYVVGAFAPKSVSRPEDLAVHVVNDVVGNEPIVVTHCDLTHSTRVLTRDADGDAPTSVCIGGFDSCMLLDVDGSVFKHHASTLPFEDVPFTSTTWQHWLTEHPDTLVYTGRPC